MQFTHLLHIKIHHLNRLAVLSFITKTCLNLSSGRRGCAYRFPWLDWLSVPNQIDEAQEPAFFQPRHFLTEQCCFLATWKTTDQTNIMLLTGRRTTT